MVLDVFSKCGRIVPLKDKKKSETVMSAFKTIFKEENQSIYGLIKVTNIIANILKSYYKNNIILYSIENEEKAICLRWNRTIKTNTWKQFTVQGNAQYLDLLPKY